MLLCRLVAVECQESTMTKFQTIQIANFLTEQKFVKGCSDLREYERAKKYLFPFDRPDPLQDLDYAETVQFVTDWLKV